MKTAGFFSERWQRLSPADRRRVPLVLGILLVAGVLLAHALLTLPARTKATQDLSRVRGRTQQVKNAPKAPPPRWTGRLPAALGREVAGLKAELERQRARLDDLAPRFAPVDDLEANRQLQEALTRLADDSGLDLELLETRGLKKEERALAPTVQRQMQLAQANPYKRPLVRLQARASYRGLMQFLGGLQGLPYTVSPVWLSLEAKTDAPAGGRPRLQWLQVTMDLTL
ncbi:MAG: hypothetical protein QM750_31875 [Rubrivivax sp.]